ncbi:MAG: minor capsid protein [Lactobacillus sp.]|nr:MAG: minor capsid protein [Lactobacillus sp.]
MDLDERLCEHIQSLGGNAAKCGLGFVPANGQLSLQADPGSRALQTYFNGDADMAMNFDLALNDQSYKAARETLNPIADMLVNLEELESSDGSFLFDHIDITGMPFNQLVDQTGNLYWITNFVVYVTKINK